MEEQFGDPSGVQGGKGVYIANKNRLGRLNPRTFS